MISKEAVSTIKESLKYSIYRIENISYVAKYGLSPEHAVRQKQAKLDELRHANDEIRQYEKENWK